MKFKGTIDHTGSRRVDLPTPKLTSPLPLNGVGGGIWGNYNEMESSSALHRPWTHHVECNTCSYSSLRFPSSNEQRGSSTAFTSRTAMHADCVLPQRSSVRRLPIEYGLRAVAFTVMSCPSVRTLALYALHSLGHCEKFTLGFPRSSVCSRRAAGLPPNMAGGHASAIINPFLVGQGDFFRHPPVVPNASNFALPLDSIDEWVRKQFKWLDTQGEFMCDASLQEEESATSQSYQKII
ncbi:hypothetical protein IE53DRAFT_8952 [Violaceomyces palustris]|uniref:Uncharacterized protein n=1 Tax=Violaceomyces palustris TaxID=1673888 RepID=A0ACD0P2M0_9BASI|nr:hypothetical protein IE53DRAFT_8952 [Violaceomyces palustris]